MGEYAEYQLQYEMRRGTRHTVRPRSGRNPIEAHCSECGKGIRPIAGDIHESMKQHMKAKHKMEYKPEIRE